MKSHLNSHLFLAGALLFGFGPVANAQDARVNLPGSARRMDEALDHKPTVAAGRVGQKFRKLARRFEAPIFPAFVAKGPGLEGAVARKEPKSLEGKIDPANSVVEVGSNAAFLDLTDAETADAEHRNTVKARLSDPQATSADPRAGLVSPANGSVLAPVQDFSWNAGYVPQDYWLAVGSCQDCNDILNQDMGLNRTARVFLPTDGRLIFVSLFTLYRGDWYWFDYEFIANNGAQPAQMMSPTNGATLAASQTFDWSAGYFVDEYYLYVGSCFECTDILIESQGRNLARTVTLPTDGRTVYVTLFSAIGGQWYWFDYQYGAATVVARPVHINVTNNLDYPLDVMVNGSVVGRVSASLTQYVDVTVSSLSLAFTLVRPTLSGRALGDLMAGVFDTIPNPSGTYNFTVNNQIGQQFYFKPLVTNNTPIPLLIEVNGGLEAQNRCNCTAPAGVANVATGYYRLFSNSNIRLYIGSSNYTGRYWFWGTDSNGFVGDGGTLPGYVEALTGRARFTANTVP